MFKMSNKFYALSPWLCLLGSTMCFALSVLSGEIYMDVRLFAIVFLGELAFFALTLAASPFAIVKLARTTGTALRQINFKLLIKSVIVPAATQGGKQLGRMTSKGARFADANLKAGAGALTHGGTRMVQRVDWSANGRRALWGAANIAATFLPLLLLALFTFIFATFPSVKNQVPALFFFPAVLGLPFAFIAGVALKTKLDMRRIFSYSPKFLKGMRRTIFSLGLIQAALGTVYMVFAMPMQDRGWLIILVPIVVGAAIAQTLVLCAVVWLLETIARRSNKKGPPSAPPVTEQLRAAHAQAMTS